MLQKTIENTAFMQRLIGVLQDGEEQKSPSHDSAMQALMAAVEKGVQCENGVYRFFDPGIPLIVLRDLPIIRQKKLVKSEDWYDLFDWARRAVAPQERLLRIPVKESFNKNFTNQKKFLTADEEVVSTRSVVAFLVINALATGTRLLPDCWVRCIDEDLENGDRVLVGDFDAGGVGVAHYWDVARRPGIGLAASQKS